jgi:hypothetical protein
VAGRHDVWRGVGGSGGIAVILTPEWTDLGVYCGCGLWFCACVAVAVAVAVAGWQWGFVQHCQLSTGSGSGCVVSLRSF